MDWKTIQTLNLTFQQSQTTLLLIMSPKPTSSCIEKESLVQKALDAIKSGEVCSAYAAKKKFGVSRVLLSRRLKSTQLTSSKAHEVQQVLMHLKKEVFVK